MQLSAEQKQSIVDQHNKMRNDIATGQIAPFDTAKRMGEMKWDDELASLAELNTKRCVFSHDECRNTEAYSFAGQNIAASMTNGDTYQEVNPMIEKLTNDWFSEKKDTNMKYINAFHSPHNKK